MKTSKEIIKNEDTYIHNQQSVLKICTNLGNHALH